MSILENIQMMIDDDGQDISIIPIEGEEYDYGVYADGVYYGSVCFVTAEGEYVSVEDAMDMKSSVNVFIKPSKSLFLS
jgi:hypothetical protein